VLHAEHLGQRAAITAAYAATTRSAVTVLTTLIEQVTALQGHVNTHLGGTRTLRSSAPNPDLGPVLDARVLAEFGDDPDRYPSAKARKNYTATSPITRASSKKKALPARHVHNTRLIDAVMTQAFSALNASPGARTNYDQHRAPQRPTPTGQPTRRHPARLPQNPHPPQRNNRLVTPHPNNRRFTSKHLECLSSPKWVGYQRVVDN
jgi:hypothetical protein